MAEYSIITVKVTDKVVIDTFTALSKLISRANVHFEIVGIARALRLTEAADAPVLTQLVESNEFFLKAASFSVPHFTLQFIRGTAKNRESAGAVYDEFHFNYQQGNEQGRLSETEALGVITTVNERIPTITRPNKKGGATEFTDLQATHLSILERLEQAATKQIEQFNSFLRDKLGELEEQRNRLENEYGEKRSTAETQLDSDRQRLRATEDELEARKKTLDDRDNTHVRRQIRQDLNQILRERLGNVRPSWAHLFRELPIHLLFIALIGVAALLSYHFSAGVIELLTDNLNPRGLAEPYVITTLLKQSLATITLLAGIIYYTRWLMRQHHRYIESDDEIRRYQADFERASWVVETALEWRREQASQIPTALLEAISRRLFLIDQRAEAIDQAPVDLLASALLGSAAKVRLHTPMADVEIDGKQLRKAEFPKGP